MKTHLLLVDFQNDFCIKDDGHGNRGTLVVPGADADADRVATMIRRLGDKIDGMMPRHVNGAISAPSETLRHQRGRSMPTV